MRKKTILLAATALACFLAIMTPAVFGMLQPDYSHLRDYISELGATGAPYAYWVNYFGFLPAGVLVLIVCLMLPAILPRNRITLAACIFLLSLSIGYVGAAVAPCDVGCPTEGSPQQSAHNLIGVVEYLGMALSLLLFSHAFTRAPSWTLAGRLSLLTAAIVLSCFIAMAIPDLQELRGLWQRIAELSIFSWLLFVVIKAVRQQSRIGT